MPNSSLKELRGVLDGNDPFMSGGHQIIKTRRGSRTTPEWVSDKQKIKQMLLRSFPYMKTNALQRARAGRWARVIHLYFAMQMTYGQVAAELRLKPRRVENLIRAIYNAAAGMKANGRGPLSTQPHHRPKTSDVVSTPLGS